MGKRETKMNASLSKIYYNLKNSGGYGTLDKLWEAAGCQYRKSQVHAWLKKQDPYTLHLSRKLKFKRSRYYVPNMNNLFQTDLCDMRTLKKHNYNFCYILTVIDVFFKKAWAVALKTKDAATVIQAFKRIFADRKPLYLQSDKGKEFVAKKVQNYLKQENIKFYTSQNPDTKCSVVERFHRTLKSKMWKYFTHVGTYKYIDILDDLIQAYNNTKHSAINMTPNQVNKNNEKQVYEYLYSGNGRYKTVGNRTVCKLKIGDNVRITREKFTFEKGYEANWSTEVFVVSKILKTSPVRYEIKDLKDENIKGSFYAAELQHVLVDRDTKFKIDKILTSRGKGVSREVLVKWRGYGDKFNSWVLASTLEK